jgi:hypothetical protein
MKENLLRLENDDGIQLYRILSDPSVLTPINLRDGVERKRRSLEG